MVMQTLRELETTTFTWRPLKGVKKTIALHAGEGDAVFATLRQERGQPTLVETAEGRWTIAKDPANKKATLITDEMGRLAGSFVSAKHGEGTLTLADGQTFHWAPTHKGQAERAFYDASGARVARFWKDWQFLKVEDRGAADPMQAARDAFPLLVVLGRYIGVGSDEDDAAITAALIVAT